MNEQDGVNREGIFRGLVVLAMILAAAVLRIAPHPWNLTPVGAMALFGGAMFRDKRTALLLPLGALFAGDLAIGFHKLMPIVYASFLVNVVIGFWLRERRSVARIGAATLAGAVQFFVITNFATWAFLGTYPLTATGLGTCYLRGLPLLRNTLAGDAIYAALLFGGFALAEKYVPRLQEPATKTA